jgi:hypothetical protein
MPTTANAGYTGLNCPGSAYLGNRICLDISEQNVYLYPTTSSPYAAYVYPALGPVGLAPGPFPTAGWIAVDASCNAYTRSGVPGLVTQFGTGTAYGLLGTTIGFGQFSTVFHGWNTAPITAAQSNTLAYYANSNTGFECLVVP